MTSLAVVIPTKDRNDKVSQTVNSLLFGSRVPEEIIVVDDGSAQPVILQLQLANPNHREKVTVVRNEVSKGSSAARNIGAKKARSEVILFLDDDVLATENLVSIHAEHHSLSTDRTVAMGRLVLSPKLRSTEFSFWLEHEGDFSEIAGYKTFDPLGGLISANFSILRNDFLVSGGFSEGFPFNRNEDTEFGARLRVDFGLLLRFLPDAVGIHDTDLDAQAFLVNSGKGGLSKAYWSLIEPNHSDVGLRLAEYGQSWRSRRAVSTYLGVWALFNLRGLNKNPPRNSRKALRRLAGLRQAQYLIGSLGVCAGWSVYAPASRNFLESNMTLTDAAAFSYSTFFPGVWFLSTELARLGRPDDGKAVLMENEQNSWSAIGILHCSLLVDGRQDRVPDTRARSSRRPPRIRSEKHQHALIESLESVRKEKTGSTLSYPAVSGLHKAPQELPRMMRRFPAVFGSKTFQIFVSYLLSRRYAALSALLRELIAGEVSVRHVGKEVFAAQKMRFFVESRLENYSVWIDAGKRAAQQFPHDADLEWSYQIATSVGGDQVVGSPQINS